MAIETYKVIEENGKKKMAKELINPMHLDAQLKGGWYLSKEEAKAGKANDPPGRPQPKKEKPEE